MRHHITSNHHVQNCIVQTVRIIDADLNIIVELEPAETPVRVVPAEPTGPSPRAVVGLRADIPVIQGTGPARIEGLPLKGDILVPLVVVSAMRELGMCHPGRVFTPQPLIFDEEQKPACTPGLIEHYDVEHRWAPVRRRR